ncbi:hypothetical protein HWV62_13152 [Athelia sp. TMB]|nr:hypothetical protein HWV62_13152 [Athelia sp. TMB]
MPPGGSKRAKVSRSGTPEPFKPIFSGLHDKTGIVALPSELLLEIASNFTEISVIEVRRNPPSLPDHYRQRFNALRALSQTCKELRSVCLPLAWERLEACTVAGPENGNRRTLVEKVHWLDELETYFAVYQILRSCPEVETLTSNEGDGSKLVGAAVATKCTKLKTIRGLFLSEGHSKKLAKLVPDMHTIECTGSLEAQYRNDLISSQTKFFEQLGRIEIRFFPLSITSHKTDNRDMTWEARKESCQRASEKVFETRKSIYVRDARQVLENSKFQGAKSIVLQFMRWLSISPYDDGGKTGCSLSLTSKAVNKASASFRHHSVALKGLPSALMFAHFLGKHNQTRDGQLFVRHLYVTNGPFGNEGNAGAAVRVGPTPSGLAKLAAGRQAYGATMSKATLAQNVLTANPCQSQDGLMRETLHRILLKIAPTIFTLSLSLSTGFLEPDIPSLPALTELTLHYHGSWSTSKVLKTIEPLHALRRLDLLGISCHERPGDVLANVMAIAPSLTHICFPALDTSSFMGISHWRDLDMGMRSLRCHLNVRVELDPRDEQTAVFKTPEGSDSDYASLKREVGEWFDHAVLLVRAAKFQDCHDEQEQNWRDRIHGQEGRWVGNPSSEERMLSSCK